MPSTTTHFINPLELSTLDGIGVTFNGATGFAYSGSSVAPAGDVNGDGFDDVLIAAPGVAATYLIFGHRDAWDSMSVLSSINGTNGVVIVSGGFVARAGDVNGDGIDDLVTGASGYTSYLTFGHMGVWNTPLIPSSVNGTNGVVITGGGSAVAGVGDVNGDGIDDLVIKGASGSTYLTFGHTGAWDTPLNLTSINGTNGTVITGGGPVISGVGDVNGDGINDLVIGMPGFTAYLIFGHTGTWGTPLNLTSMNGTDCVVITGGGNVVAGAGDVNRDGIDDIVIGDVGATPGGLCNAGSTYLIFGHRGIWESTLMLSTLNGTTGVIINGVAAEDQSGASVALGDMNGDGIDDVLIGAPCAGSNYCSQLAGSAYLIFGHTGVWDNILELASLNGTNGIVINGVVRDDNTGISVAFAGDVNGDGINDVLIGAYRANPRGLQWSGSTYLIFGDTLELLINTLTINQGETIFLNNSMLAAYHPHNLAMNTSIFFNITNVVHGTFSTFNFLQSALSQQLVSFTHDGSIYPPSYKVTIGNCAMVGPVVATVSFDVSPVIYVTPFSVGQGQSVVLSNQSIRATSLYFPSDGLMFDVSNVLYGNFIKTNTTVIENQFNQSFLTQGEITFVTDGSAHAPSYDISVSDGRITTEAIHGIVNFNAAPILVNNQLTLTLGQQKVILSSYDLSAIDTTITLRELIFTPSTHHCHFENLNLPGTVLNEFEQGNVQGGQIVFVWDGHTTPTYNISVSDGLLSTGRPASITIVPAQNITRATNTTETTSTGAIVGGVISTVVGLGLLYGLQWYLKKKTNDQFQKMFLESTSDEDKTFNRDVVRPIANKIFDAINTTGFFGQRTEANTKAYMRAIGKIISELKQQKANLDLNAMEPVDKEAFLNEIANQTRQQSLPKRKGLFASCVGYFKVEATPQDVEHAAEDIAFSVAAWQNRHKRSIVAKNSSLGLELGKQSGIGFSDEAANEDVPPEKQFKWMQNHMKMMEQRRQQEQKQLEDRLIQGQESLEKRIHKMEARVN